MEETRIDWNEIRIDSREPLSGVFIPQPYYAPALNEDKTILYSNTYYVDGNEVVAIYDANGYWIKTNTRAVGEDLI